MNLKSFTDREKKLVALAQELEERLNTATAVALHYDSCPDENKTPDDYLCEVRASLFPQGHESYPIYYDVVKEIVKRLKQERKIKGKN
jgi:hypothetical protein